MRTHDLWVAYGVTPCKTYGHKLRTRAGHCIQCNSSYIAYLKRYSQDQYVYFAYSKQRRLIKIGTTLNLYQREESLNEQEYGGCNDWKIISSAFVYGAGQVEYEIHRNLSEYIEISFTYKDGKNQATRELFNCSKSHGLKVYKKLVS